MKFIIKEGRHYNSNWLSRLYGLLLRNPRRRVIKKTVMFSESCWYPESYVTNSGYNKLLGGGNVLHQLNSARWAWMPDYTAEGSINLYSYVYTNGEWDAKLLGHVKVGQWIELSIHTVSTGYKFCIGGYVQYIDHPNASLKKLLYPYFGGQDTSPRDIQISIK